MKDRPRLVAYRLIDPAYFLYAHAAELALKACLLCHGETVPQGRAGHDIVGLYQICRSRDFLKADLIDLSVQGFKMLGVANKNHGYRYPERDFSKPQTVLPELDWVKEELEKIIGCVSPQVKAWAEANPVQSGPVPIRIALVKPSGPIDISRTSC